MARTTTSDTSTTSLAGYAIERICLRIPPWWDWSIGPSTVDQLTNSNDPEINSPSKRAPIREAIRRSELGKAKSPATARGTAPRYPTSARDGNGIATGRSRSYAPQPACPKAHERLKAPRKAHAIRAPGVRIAAQRQAPQVISGAR